MRLLECGLMNGKDVQNCSKLTECLAYLLYTHRTGIINRCPKANERATQIKNILKSNPFGLKPLLEEFACKSNGTCSCG